jgi:hypothetical protein
MTDVWDKHEANDIDAEIGRDSFLMIVGVVEVLNHYIATALIFEI